MDYTVSLQKNAVPSPLRNKKWVWLLTERLVESHRPVYVAGTFKSAYQLALFKLSIASPNIGERAAREQAKGQGLVWIWNTMEFETVEEALWSPLGKAAKLERVEVKRT